MATIRRAGFGTIFELENDVVGIGTDNPTHKLQALGNIRSEAATDIGISSLTTYQGFVNKEARFTGGQIDIESQSGAISGEIVIDGDVTVSSATTFTSGPQNLSVTDTFTLPSGDTNSRALKPTAGSLRFNQDFATLEFYTGNNWATVNTFTEMQNSPGNRGRAVLSSGSGSSPLKDFIEFFNIATQGNSQDFGVTTQGRVSQGSCSNEIRGVFGGGYSGGKVNTMDYITIASEGDAIDFGDLTTSRNGSGGCSSSTRGLWCGGQTPTYINVIEYAEIMTLGNAIDFGDLSITNLVGDATVSSPTRGITGGGLTNPSSPVVTSQIDFVIISSKANSVKFGDLTTSNRNSAGASNRIRGVFGGADSSPTFTNTIDYITMASEGNATDFGSLSTAKTSAGGVANQTRATFCGGYISSYPSTTNSIEFVEIASTGNGQDFGDLSNPKGGMGRVSDSHGGLGGF